MEKSKNGFNNKKQTKQKQTNKGHHLLNLMASLNKYIYIISRTYTVQIHC